MAETLGTAEFAGWRLDLDRRQLRNPDGVLVDLSAAEYRLLRAFIDHPLRVLTREQLLDFAYLDAAEVYDRAVDIQVSRLRRRFGDEGQTLIRTLRGAGYEFTARVARR